MYIYIYIFIYMYVYIQQKILTIRRYSKQKNWTFVFGKMMLHLFWLIWRILNVKCNLISWNSLLLNIFITPTLKRYRYRSSCPWKARRVSSLPSLHQNVIAATVIARKKLDENVLLPVGNLWFPMPWIVIIWHIIILVDEI